MFDRYVAPQHEINGVAGFIPVKRPVFPPTLA
jgi:hypothetical protein